MTCGRGMRGIAIWPPAFTLRTGLSARVSAQHNKIQCRMLTRPTGPSRQRAPPARYRSAAAPRAPPLSPCRRAWPRHRGAHGRRASAPRASPAPPDDNGRLPRDFDRARRRRCGVQRRVRRTLGARARRHACEPAERMVRCPASGPRLPKPCTGSWAAFGSPAADAPRRAASPRSRRYTPVNRGTGETLERKRRTPLMIAAAHGRRVRACVCACARVRFGRASGRRGAQPVARPSWAAVRANDWPAPHGGGLAAPLRRARGRACGGTN
jgi:hypothetical protein